MNPKYRVWSKTEKKMLKHIQEINFEYSGELVGVETESLDYHGANEIELMQSTGLKDKNGVEIYEGDIVKYKYGVNTFTEVVTYNKDFAGFGLVDDDGYGGTVFTFGELAEDVDFSSLEVAGNIYENPELAEEE